MAGFGEFIDKKTRESRKRLKLVEQILTRGGMTVKNHVEDREPYLFVLSPGKKVSFAGVRIYQTGESIAYRIQKEEKTHPYGKAYRLDIAQMYDDLTSEDDVTEKKAAYDVIEALPKELKKFFEESALAERQMRDQQFDQMGDPLSRVIVGTQANDYSQTTGNKFS